MPVPDYGKSLSDAIGKASQSAEQAKRQQEAIAADKLLGQQRFATNQSLASGFCYDHLEKLLAQTLQTCAAQGYRFVGELIEEAGAPVGTFGFRLATGKRADVSCTIQYSEERLKLTVLGRPDEYQWPLYHDSTEIAGAQFENASALRWFQTRLPAAVAAVLEHCAITK